jgi:hypothetical protein
VRSERRLSAVATALHARRFFFEYDIGRWTLSTCSRKLSELDVRHLSVVDQHFDSPPDGKE